MNLVIFGANGPTGRLVTKQALDEGHIVTAFTRHPDAFPLRHERLQVMHGDVCDLSAVERAISGQDAVLSTLGTPFRTKPITLYSEGMSHILLAMQRYHVNRLVCVSSSTMDPLVRSHDTGGGFLFEQIMKPFVIHVIGRTAYADTQKMETLVMGSDRDWTIVRASGLFTTPNVTRYHLDEDFIGRYTSRRDLADCLLKQLDDTRYLRKAVMIATVSVQPNMLLLILREAFQRRPSAMRSTQHAAPHT